MIQNFDLIIKSLSECTQTELAEFVSMVESEGEVVGGLKRRVEKRGYKLVFARGANSLAAVGALKTPYSNYRSGVFKKAKSLCRPDDYQLELGWIVVSPQARRNGLAGRLADNLLQKVPDKRVFATVRMDNEGMQRCLKSRGFARTGEPYPSENRKANIVLLVR